MDNKNLLIIAGFLVFIISAYFISINQSEVVSAKENFAMLSKQSAKQAENIANNSKMVKQLLEEITTLNQRLMSSVPKEDIKENGSGVSNLKLSKVMTDLKSLKEQVTSLQKTKNTHEVNLNLPTPTKMEDYPSILQAKKEKSRIETEKTIAAYETALYEGESDISWENDLDKKMGEIISSKEIGADVQLQGVECHTNLCKVNISYSDKTPINRRFLIKSLGNVSVYGHRLSNSAPGQKEYAIYISKEGVDISPIDSRNE